MSECFTCRLLAERDAGTRPLWDNIHRSRYWDVVHSYNTSLPGWLVLVARRHISAVAEMTKDEATELGKLQWLASLALHDAVGCRKTYVAQFAEHPHHPHVHYHIIPVMVGMPDDARGPNVFQHLGVPEEQQVSEAVMNGIAERVRNVLQSFV